MIISMHVIITKGQKCHFTLVLNSLKGTHCMLEVILLGIVSVVTFISYFPQIVKCLRTKQAEDLSVWSWVLWATSALSYTLYAFLCTNSVMLIFESCLEFGFCLTILICAIVYRKKDNKGGTNG